VLAIPERPVQRYSEVFGLGAEEQGFVVAFDIIHLLGCSLLSKEANLLNHDFQESYNFSINKNWECCVKRRIIFILLVKFLPFSLLFKQLSVTSAAFVCCIIYVQNLIWAFAK